MSTPDGPSEGAAMDASKRSGDEIEQAIREKATGEKEWAAAEAAGDGAGVSDEAKPRPDKPATGERQAAQNRENESPA